MFPSFFGFEVLIAFAKSWAWSLEIATSERSKKNNANIKSLETKRTAALKASHNLIAAIEQGIITEQTKERLKELETQISQLDFDIEQEKQRTFAELTPAKVIQFLNKAICGDVQDIGVRKALVKYLIRDIILYNDKIIINYYFSDPLKKHNNSIESVKETEKQSKEAAPLSDFQSSYKGDNSPPQQKECEPTRFAFFVAAAEAV